MIYISRSHDLNQYLRHYSVDMYYRALRKFEDITVLLITAEFMTIETKNFTGLKNYSVSRPPKNYNFYNRTLL